MATTKTPTLELELRETLGKKVKQLRRAGIIPVHLYGRGIEPRALQCGVGTLVRALSRAGSNTPITLNVPGEDGAQLAFAREIQWDALRNDILHVDFLVVAATQLVSAQVPIVLTGESPGARESGGVVVQQLRELAIEALPLEMPSQIEVDLTTLTDPEGNIRAGELSLPANVSLETDPEEVVVRIELVKAVVEEEGPVAEAAPGKAGEGDAGGESKAGVSE